jgi:hypothetical protein
MAVYANLTIDQGADFVSTITVEQANGLPFDLSGYTARGQIRRSYTSTTAYNFSVSVSSAIEGELTLSLDSNTTLNMRPGRYVYDVILVQGTSSDITRVIEGQVEITPRVTV